MNRREALTAVACLMGSAVWGANAFLSSTQQIVSETSRLLSARQMALLDEVGETILPATTDSPGARAAKIGEFMNTMVSDCYDEPEQKIFIKGLTDLNNLSKKAASKYFLNLSTSERHTLLVNLDKEAKQHLTDTSKSELPHYFTLMKQLTLLGYFTSEPGATQALRYLPVPGRFMGCLPYKKGDKAWAM